MADEVFDVGIVGYGPAGITAAIYAARKKLRVALLGELPGGEVRNSGVIENWPGDGETDGNALADKFIKHLDMHREDVEIISTVVSRIEKESDGIFTLKHGQGVLRAKTVIYSAGRHPRLLNVPGEEEFKNRGVTYCATCDAPLFAEQDVAVIGGGNTGAEAVIMLQNIARKIFLLHLTDSLTADPVLIQNFQDDEKVEILYNAATKKIGGEAMVSSLTYEDTATNQEQTLKVTGVFVTIGSIPNTDPVKDLVALDDFGAIVADRYGVTNVEGFFAAGDVTNIRDAQIVVAAGHGCSAALSAGDYINRT